MVCGEGCFSLFYGQLFFPSLSPSLSLSLPVTDCPSLGQILFMISEEKEEVVVVVLRGGGGGGCPL